MNDQLARSLFMDYLYNEISEEEKLNLESYLEDHPKLKNELDQLRKTRSLLQKMPEVDPAKKLLVMEPRKRSFSQWWHEAGNLLPRSFFGKASFAVAACLILLLIVGSLTKFHIETSSNGIAISMGYSPTVNNGISAQQASALVKQIHRENAAMLSKYARQIDQQNKEQLKQVVNYFDQKRMQDLQLVDQTLDELQQNTNYKLHQTNQYLGQVLQTVSLKNNNN
ncbi:MAG TPA: hypothetical protein VJ964_08700 [Balneolaceae bacterium]|nr:hypothetical protein [Balneolaceae bacterium]